MTIDELKLLEAKVKEEIENAKELPDRGVHNPHVIPNNVQGRYKELVNFSQSKLITLEYDAAQINRHLQPLKNYIADSETRILTEWNKRERFVKSRAEAKSAINNYKEEKRFKLKDIAFAFLFFFEFCYGFYIFKNLVLPDNTVQNYVTSFIVGLMVFVIGIFVKFLPNSFIQIKHYELSKIVITVLSCVFMITFLLCLVQMRETTDSFDLTKATQKISSLNWQDLIFNLSLLCAIIFGGTFFAHWHKTHPNKLLKKMHDEGVELLNWYESDHFEFKRACTEYDSNKEKQENVILPGISSVKEVLSRYNDNHLTSLIRQAIKNFIRGSSRIPLTSEKEQG